MEMLERALLVQWVLLKGDFPSDLGHSFSMKMLRRRGAIILEGILSQMVSHSPPRYGTIGRALFISLGFLQNMVSIALLWRLFLGAKTRSSFGMRKASGCRIISMCTT